MAKPDIEQIEPDLEERQTVEYIRGIIDGILDGQTSVSVGLKGLPTQDDFRSGFWAHDAIRGPLTAQARRNGDDLTMDVGTEAIGYGFTLDGSRLKYFGSRVNYSIVKGVDVPDMPTVTGKVLAFAKEIVDFVALAPRAAHSI